MANTITLSKNGIMLSAIDSNWLWSDSFPGYDNGIHVVTIVFKAGITSDNTIILRDERTTGPQLLAVTHATGVMDTYNYHGALISPVLLYSEQTFTSGALFSICFERR